MAVVNPTRSVIAYHLLWKDDVHGSWIPFTVPTDEEVVWVGYDSTRAPTDIWTFWHGTLLHTDWRDRGQVAIDVQWGKHGSLPHRTIESDLPALKKLNMFYAFTWIGLPDIWLGDLTRRGPFCFCHGYGRYRDFSKELPVGEHIDAVVRLEDPVPALVEVFGRPYSKKTPLAVIWLLVASSSNSRSMDANVTERVCVLTPKHCDASASTLLPLCPETAILQRDVHHRLRGAARWQ